VAAAGELGSRFFVPDAPGWVGRNMPIHSVLPLKTQLAARTGASSIPGPSEWAFVGRSSILRCIASLHLLSLVERCVNEIRIHRQGGVAHSKARCKDA
jgi:hypothetical protein